MSDWLMVIITLVYTVTTIFISVLNYKTVKIATRQYHSDMQLRLMPCLYIQVVKQKRSMRKITINTNISNFAPVIGEFAFSVQNVGNGIAKEIQYEFSEDTETVDIFYRIVSLPCQDKRDFVLRIVHSEDCLAKSEHLVTEMRVVYRDLFDCEYSQTLTISVCMSNGKMKLETFYLTAPKCIKNTYTEKRPKMRRWLQYPRWWFRNFRWKIRNKD